jgi:hypothetical protein
MHGATHGSLRLDVCCHHWFVLGLRRARTASYLEGKSSSQQSLSTDVLSIMMNALVENVHPVWP